jgi:diguanylate cyclase (GGDEF)-like protein
VLPKDDTQQNAELRQAFLKHLPRRIETVRKRGHRICSGVWDLNTLTLLFQDVQGLAGAAGRYGFLDASERLYQVEQTLEPWVRAPRLPDAAERQAIEAQINALADVGAAPTASLRTPRDFLVPPPERLAQQVVPSSLRPPDEYWRRYSHRAVERISSDSHGQPPPAPAPAPVVVEPGHAGDTLVNASSAFQLDTAPPLSRAAEAPVARVEIESGTATSPGQGQTLAATQRRGRGGRVFYLSDIAPFGRELTQALAAMGYVVDRLDSAEELKEVLGSIAPDLILLDAGYFEQIEHLGEFVKRVRQRISSRVPLMTIAAENDLNARLKAMRAGADAFVPQPISAADAALRVRDLLDIDADDPFRVMIVEDDRSQALFAESVLRKAGMSTQAVTDPLQTLDELERFKPDLVLMDLYMPNISGLELTAIVREREQFINIPIVFLSGEQDSEKHFEALSAGGDDFLAKPIRPKFLISAVTNRARRARQLARRRVLDPKDSTTGLYHRTFLIDRLNGLLGAEERPDGVGGLLFIEVEGTQNLREQRGLAVYESVMRQVGAAIAGHARLDEHAARYGDASYVLLAPARTDSALETLAEEIVEGLGGDVALVDGQAVMLSARVGVAVFGPQFADAAEVLNAAERACARARQQAGERVLVHRSGPGSGVVDAIRRALADNAFQLLFQPIVSLHTTGEEQYEVLLRLRTDGGEVIAAGALFDAAALAGLVADVDRWCLAQCLRVVEERKRAGRPVRLFVNQSCESMRDSERIGWLRQIMDTRRIPGDSLALEFRRHDLVGNIDAALPFVSAMREMGIKVVVDDLDASLDSLQLLGTVPADYVKLADRYTLGNAAGSHAEELKTLVRAAHDRSRYVMAAKVETAQSAALLWTLGVDLIQGNFVQQPGAELGFDFSASAL